MKLVIRRSSKNLFIQFLYIYLIICQAAIGEKNGPKFVEPIPNVTVTVGKDASLPCVVNNLGTYKVIWIHIDRQMVLTMHKYVISRIPRYSISVSNKNTWILHVTRAQQEDRGYYMCQVNTNPIMSQVGYLQVIVPPVFVDDGVTSTATVVVRENQNLTLTCKAQGFPPPKIAWKREDGRDITLNKIFIGPVFSGEAMHFERISRTDISGYLCIAANGVPPAVIKRIFINVEFSPIILVTNQLMATTVGSRAVLECQTEANPIAKTYWMRNKEFIQQNYKYHINLTENSYRTYTKLEVQNVSKEDFGEYECLSKNELGETEGTIRLYEYVTSTTEMAVTRMTTALNTILSSKTNTSTSNSNPIDDSRIRNSYIRLNVSSRLPNFENDINEIPYPKIIESAGESQHFLLINMAFSIITSFIIR